MKLSNKETKVLICLRLNKNNTYDYRLSLLVKIATEFKEIIFLSKDNRKEFLQELKSLFSSKRINNSIKYERVTRLSKKQNGQIIHGKYDKMLTVPNDMFLEIKKIIKE